jgi:ATP/maltotriose-dependent transcriptional regulator MalT
LVQRDRYGDALEGQRNLLALARKVGDRVNERSALGEMSFVLMLTGEWDEALSVASTITDDEMRDAANELASIAQTFAEIGVNRGDLGGLERVLSAFERFATSGDTQERAVYSVTRASWLRAIGNNQEALAAAKEGLAAMDRFGPGHQAVRAGLVESVEAAFALGDLDEVAALLAKVQRLSPGEVPPSMRAQTARFRARLGVATGDDDDADSLFTTATALFREIDAPFWVAVTLLEHAEWLSRSAQPADAAPLATEAAGIFTRLGATPWLERACRLNLTEVVAS